MIIHMIKKTWKFARKRGITFLAGVGATVVCYLAISWAIEPTSKSSYCGSACHEMNISYQTWELSSHGSNNLGIRVECIDCHLPPKEKFITHVIAKAHAGANDMYKHKFGPEYDRTKMRQKVLQHFPTARCTHCHNDLLNRSSLARIPHLEALNNPDKPESRCVYCHENVGHERNNKIFAESIRKGK